ncbi:MAG: class I SAM-dependent methyltransferase [Dehalococcoidia bacterium]|jgi:ubiquinone/menaquinone biosynthesis C-methylase UbiE
MLIFKPMFLLNYETLIDPLLAEIRKFTPEFCGMSPGDRVLDVCCGTGAQVIEYRRRGIIATGLDIDPSMLKAALRNRAKNNLANISFYLADATELSFVDNCFDYVSVSLALHDKSKLARYKVVSEMIRVLKPDGALIFIDYPVPHVSRIWGFLSRTVEFIAGGDHYEGFKDYIISGGLEHILKVFNLHEEKRDYLKGGLVAIIKARVT